MSTNDRTARDTHANDSADKHTHGTHGRGRGDEELVEPTRVEPDTTGGTGRGADAWGSEASGGSTIDKRSPEDWKRSQEE
jgi:hypothetical protein